MSIVLAIRNSYTSSLDILSNNPLFKKKKMKEEYTLWKYFKEAAPINYIKINNNEIR